VILAKIIDGHAAWQAVWTATVAGIAVSVVFALAVLGGTRSADLRRDSRHGSAAMFAVLAVAGLGATLGAVVYAITLITTK
jgi:hypothetical protein